MAIEAGKHIVTDLDFGLRIVEKAENKGVRLAVNQNGRWAPHWSYIRQAIKRGILGEVASVRLSVNWDHNWIAGSIFENICFLGDKTPARLFASTAVAPGQRVKPPLLSQVLIEYPGAQAMIFFDANTCCGEQDATYVSGTKGSVLSVGPDLNEQAVTLATPEGLARPQLRGSWFPDGFHGTMGELLRAIEEKREPENAGRNNLKSLELCFAAIASAARKEPVTPGSVRKLPA